MNYNQIEIKTQIQKPLKPKIKLIRSFIGFERKRVRIKFFALIGLCLFLILSILFGVKILKQLQDNDINNKNNNIIIVSQKSNINKINNSQKLANQNQLISTKNQNQAIITPISSEAMSILKYPIVLVDDKIICALQNIDDFDWIKNQIFKNNTKIPEGKAILRGFAQKVEIINQGSQVLESSKPISKQDALKLIQENTSLKITAQVKKQFYVNYKTIYIHDSSIKLGKTKIKTTGKKGIRTILYNKIYIDMIEQSSEEISQEITKKPVDEIILINNKNLNKTIKQEDLNIPEELEEIINTELSIINKTNNTNNIKTPENINQPETIETIEIIGTIELLDNSELTSSIQVVKEPNNNQEQVSPETILSTKSNINYFPNSSVPMGKNYPNIDTAKQVPEPNQGIKGPDQGELSFAQPTKSTQINSQFGFRWGKMHYGTDFAGKIGVDVYASEAGTVSSYTGVHTGYGNIIELTHSNGYTTRYAHLSKILVKQGDKVMRGQTIGLIGVSGKIVGGSHLHFEIRQDGVPYNPTFYLD